MSNETLITADGLEKLKKELNELKSVRRIAVSQRIKEAIALGDLSENSEYDDAKNVILEDVETKERFEYTVVGTAEADPFNNRISNESPVGAAILGQNVDKENPVIVSVKAPAGEVQYKILPFEG